MAKEGMEVVEGERMEVDDEGAEKLTLDLLQVVRTAQMANGLKQDDYRRYHHHCSKTLRRLRKSLKFSHGRGKYQKRALTAEISRRDSRYLLMLLMNAEQAWSFAMEIKEEKRRKGFIIRRFAKAAKWAEKLAAVASEVAEGRTALEAEAYAAWMAGNKFFLREQWQTALEKFLEARRLFEGLAKAFGSENQIYQERISEMDGSIRFCKYSISRESGGDEKMTINLESSASSPRVGGDLLAAKIEEALAASRKEQAESFGSVEWCGKTIPIRTEKVREAILTARDAVYSMENENDPEKKVSLYDKIFIAYNDTLRIISKQAAEIQASAEDGQLSRLKVERKAELDTLNEYITHARLRQTIARNLLLVDRVPSGSKPDDLVRLYETLRQNAQDILDLESVMGHVETRTVAEAEISKFTSLRCFHLARSFQRAGQWTESIVLFERAEKLLSSAATTAEQAEDPQALQLRDFAKECVALRAQAHAQGILESIRLAEDVHSKVSLDDPVQKASVTDRQGKFQSVVEITAGKVASGAIVQLPPPLKPVPCKPTLFDIAFDGARLSDTAEVVKQITSIESGGKQAEGDKKGYLSRLFRG